VEEIKISSARVGIIGVGNMGQALLVALLKAGADPSRITFAVRHTERNAEISAEYGITPASIEMIAANSDVIMLIMKPYDLSSIMDQLRPNLKPDTLILSFLAGKKISTIESGLGDPAVVRIMPNTPTLLGAGMSIVSFGSSVREDQRKFVTDFLSAAGKSIEVIELLQDAATATSGSGPAYFFAFVEAMVKGAVDMGIDETVAKELVTQTIVGAAKMLDETGKSATTLRENVTSPNGVTFAGLKVMSESGLDSLVARAMKAAADRSREMA
jgi:pyrroline-5-carboxylate reductase